TQRSRTNREVMERHRNPCRRRRAAAAASLPFLPIRAFSRKPPSDMTIVGHGWSVAVRLLLRRAVVESVVGIGSARRIHGPGARTLVRRSPSLRGGGLRGSPRRLRTGLRPQTDAARAPEFG